MWGSQGRPHLDRFPAIAMVAPRRRHGPSCFGRPWSRLTLDAAHGSGSVGTASDPPRSPVSCEASSPAAATIARNACRCLSHSGPPDTHPARRAGRGEPQGVPLRPSALVASFLGPHRLRRWAGIVSEDVRTARRSDSVSKSADANLAILRAYRHSPNKLRRTVRRGAAHETASTRRTARPSSPPIHRVV